MNSPSEGKRKQNERKISDHTEISSENHAISATKFYGGQKRYRFLNEALSYIGETEEDARTVTIVPSESGCLNIPSDEENGDQDKQFSRRSGCR